MICRVFTQDGVCMPKEEMQRGVVPRAVLEYESGNKEPLHNLYRESGVFMNLFTFPFYRLGGWELDLRPYCRRFWAKTRYYGILEYYSPTKEILESVFEDSLIEVVDLGIEGVL